MGIWLLRYLMFFMGLTLFALGLALAVQVKHLGIHPWEVLNVALYQKFGLTIGTWSVLCGLVLIGVSFFTNRKNINIGTFLNALCIGPIMDFFLWTKWLPSSSQSWTDYFILFCGIVITGIGGGMYVAAGVGAGPRDGFMLSISEKTGLTVSTARIVVESLVLILGFALGGPVFIVTFIYTFIQSPVFQRSFYYFRHLMERVNKKNHMSVQSASIE